MPVLFANPWGLLALLGVPAILAIHFLHRHRQTIPVSTLFLIQIAREPARSGRRWHRLITSTAMWLQLLLVLLLTAILARPYLPHGVLQVAVVVDDSASMRAFRSELTAQLTALDAATRARASSTHWLVLPSNPTRPRLYAGKNPAEWIATLSEWAPVDSWRAPDSALRLARERVGSDGLVVYVTDTPRNELPGGTALIAVGRPLENVGIAGVTVTESADGTRWQAVLVNPSTKPAEREWTLQWDGLPATTPQSVTLAASGMTTISGELPRNASRLELRLAADDFTLDDSFPFVRPAPKPMAMSSLGETPEWLTKRMQRAIPRLSSSVPAAADFVVAGLPEGSPPPHSAGIIFSSAGETSAKFLSEIATPTTHPLVRGLSWAGLAVQNVPAPAPEPKDAVLVWSGNQALISLREPPPGTAIKPSPGPQLIFHFNPTLSNLDRLPAGAILLLRFVESLRTQKSATAWEPLETGQFITPLLPENTVGALTLESLAADGATTASQPLPSSARMPDAPGFFRVRDSQAVLLEAAVAFADAREGDFRHCAVENTIAAALDRSGRVSEPSDDASRTLLVLAALVALLILYHFMASPARVVSPT